MRRLLLGKGVSRFDLLQLPLAVQWWPIFYCFKAAERNSIHPVDVSLSRLSNDFWCISKDPKPTNGANSPTESPRVFLETYSVLSRDHVAPRTVDLFRVGWRDVSDTSKQAPVIEPIDPAEFRHH